VFDVIIMCFVVPWQWQMICFISHVWHYLLCLSYHSVLHCMFVGIILN